MSANLRKVTFVAVVLAVATTTFVLLIKRWMGRVAGQIAHQHFKKGR